MQKTLRDGQMDLHVVETLMTGGREEDVGITLEREVQGRGDNIRHNLRGGRRVCYACELNLLPTLLLMQQPPGWHSPGFYFGKYVVICNVATGENAFNLTYCCRRNQDPFVPRMLHER
jgi:hypothetical protein